MTRQGRRHVERNLAHERERALQARDVLIEHEEGTYLSITEYHREEDIPEMLRCLEDEDGFSAADYLLDGKFDVAREMILDKYGATFG